MPQTRQKSSRYTLAFVLVTLVLARGSSLRGADTIDQTSLLGEGG